MAQNCSVNIDYATQFPDIRDDAETTLGQCQNVLLRTLAIFDYLCRELKIDYWITGGTLLGATRHRGFVPWDCDIDIGTTVDNFSRLPEIIPHLPDDLFFQSNETDPHFPPTPLFAKLRDRYSNYREYEKNYPDSKWQNGLQLDLCGFRVLDGYYYSRIKGVQHTPATIFPLRQVPFEDIVVYAPNDVDRYLKSSYGDDYKVLPPKEQRVAHEGKADPLRSNAHSESRGVWHRMCEVDG